MQRANHAKRPTSSLGSDLFLHCQKTEYGRNISLVFVRRLFVYPCIVVTVVNVDQCASSSLVDYVQRMSVYEHHSISSNLNYLLKYLLELPPQLPPQILPLT